MATRPIQRIDFVAALNGCKTGAEKVYKIRDVYRIRLDRLPNYAKLKDFMYYFLPYVVIVGDSREQDKWIEKACRYYGIQFEWHTKEAGGNLKEGDYTFMVKYPNVVYNFEQTVAYERKGSLAEIYHNCTGYNPATKTNDRDRIEREFDRFLDGDYQKVVMLLEYGDSLFDLIDEEFTYYDRNGKLQTKNVGTTVFSTLMSWRQPNYRNFDILQSSSHETLFWLMLFDCFYYFRNQIRLEYKARIQLQGANEND